MKKIATIFTATAMILGIVGAFFMLAYAQTHGAHRRAIHSPTTAAAPNDMIEYRSMNMDDIRAN